MMACHWCFTSTNIWSCWYQHELVNLGIEPDLPSYVKDIIGQSTVVLPVIVAATATDGSLEMSPSPSSLGGVDGILNVSALSDIDLCVNCCWGQVICEGHHFGGGSRNSLASFD